MNDGFGLDDTIKLICDGDILVKPRIPLTDKEKDLMVELTFTQFHREMKRRLFLSKCLEQSEIHDYYSDKNFLQGRAFIFMKRCLNRFDKGRYKGHDFGLPDKDVRISFTSIDFNFAKDWKIITKDEATIYIYKDIKGKDFKSFSRRLRKSPLIYKELKELIQISRLKFFWTVFYRDSINQLAGETIKWKKNKGIPTRPDLKKSGVNPGQYIDSLRAIQDHQVNSGSSPFITNNNHIESPEDQHHIENSVVETMPLIFKRYFHCANVLGMDGIELGNEFRTTLATLRNMELLLKQKKYNELWEIIDALQ